MAVAGGPLIHQDGAGIIGQDAAGLIGHDGASVISQGGGNVISQGGGNVVSQGAGNVIASGGGNLIPSDGASVIASGGGNLADDQTTFVASGAGLIGHDGASVIAQGAGNYRVLAADEVPVGTRLPAAGMLVSVVSLADGRYLPVGVDGTGQPVYAVYSDLAGGYKLYLDPATQGNVLVVASAPGVTDRFRAANLVVPPTDDDHQAINADTNLATRYLRRALYSLLLRFVQEPELALETTCNEPPTVTLTRTVLGSFLVDVGHVAQDNQLACRPDVGRLIQNAADYLLARTRDPSQLTTEPKLLVPAHQDPSTVQEPLLQAAAGVSGDLQGAAARLLADDPGFFTCANPKLGTFCGTVTPFIPAIDARSPNAVADYVMGTMLDAIQGEVVDALPGLFQAMGLEQPGGPSPHLDRMLAVGVGAEVELLRVLTDGDDAPAIEEEFLKRLSGNGTYPHVTGLPQPVPVATCVVRPSLGPGQGVKMPACPSPSP